MLACRRSKVQQPAVPSNYQWLIKIDMDEKKVKRNQQ
jgi:hypothetical protein